MRNRLAVIGAAAAAVALAASTPVSQEYVIESRERIYREPPRLTIATTRVRGSSGATRNGKGVTKRRNANKQARKSRVRNRR